MVGFNSKIKSRKSKFPAYSSLAPGFTLIEMLTVISIIGILAALSVPVIKNFGKANATVSASRQLLGDIGYARQLAMSQRTTVYMVFVPTNFWNLPNGTFNSPWVAAATTYAANAYTNLLEKQLTGYACLSYGALGDQPGQHTWHYLTPWQALPEGTFIPLWKFYNAAPPLSFSDPINANFTFNVNPFSYTNTFPFPTTNVTISAVVVTNGGTSLPYLPYIAFNYLGQLANYSGQLLTSPNQGQDFDQDFTGGGVDIPLAQGTVIPYMDPSTRMLLTPPGGVGGPQVVENPPGNSTNITYNVIHIDPLTGRATLEYHKMQ